MRSLEHLVMGLVLLRSSSLLGVLCHLMIEDWSSDQLASKELALQALDTRLERWDLRVNKQLSSSLPKASAFCERRRHEKACCR